MIKRRTLKFGEKKTSTFDVERWKISWQPESRLRGERHIQDRIALALSPSESCFQGERNILERTALVSSPTGVPLAGRTEYSSRSLRWTSIVVDIL